MKVYLAARYTRRDELLRCMRDLSSIGHTVTSRWLAGDHQVDDAGLSAEAAAEERTRFAEEDLADLLAADCCISFTESPRATKSRGGRHVEHGVAIGTGKRLIVVGPRENVFHCLPHVERFETWTEAMAVLRDAPIAIADLFFGGVL